MLRLRPGEAVTCSDGAGGFRPCRFEARPALSPSGPIVRVERPAPTLTVGLAPAKGERTEWAVQKLSEAGIDRILLFWSERSVVRWAPDRTGRAVERLRAVARTAAAQSRRVWLPEVAPPVALGAVVAAEAPLVALATPSGEPPSLSSPCVLVGPEGGWSPAEEALGVPGVRLGPTVLRTETAAVTAGVLLAALRDGLLGPVR